MMGFWGGLKRPFFALAPMEDVTDTVFRQVVAGVGKPDVCFTEFANVDAILHGEVSRLKFTEEERPIVAQIWGTEPEKFCRAAEVVKKMGFDGVDINFGCPVKDVMKQGACGAMIGDYKRVGEIIEATKKGAGDLPVSVKTRIGNKKIMTEEWIGFLLEQGLAAITVHGRTVVEMSKVLAHWDEIGKAVSLRNRSKSKALIVGNGDVKNLEQARQMVDKYEVDGVMIGRGIFENPALFNTEGIMLNAQDKLELFRKHIKLWKEAWGESKNFAILKKFVKTYVNGFDGASELRVKLFACKDYLELESKLEEFLSRNT